MKFIFSNHALEQLKRRNIEPKSVEFILENPDQVLFQNNKLTYQKVIPENDKSYLIRIFVNALVDPAIIIMVYKTSKVDKYI